MDNMLHQEYFVYEREFMGKQYTLEELENRMGYHFHDKRLLKQAVTHSSFTNEQKINRQDHYERLEFLGDAVLELVASDFVFRGEPEMQEGQLTKKRASLVCEQALAMCAAELGIGDFIRLGKGEEAMGGRKRSSIVSDVMESLIGAIYLDGGMKSANLFIYRFVLTDDQERRHIFSDSKNNLQEYVQKHKMDFRYEIVGESGPEHDKIFYVEVLVNDKPMGKGQGRTKKIAEQQAAGAALLNLKKLEEEGKDECI